MIGVLNGVALDIESELGVLAKFKKIEYFVGEFGRDVGGTIEVNPVWVAFWNAPGSFADVAWCKIGHSIVLAKDIAKNYFIIGSCEISINKSCASVGDFCVKAEATKDFKTNAGATIDRNARIIAV